MSGDRPQAPVAYRDLVARPREQVIICGQAVNLWALVYLPQLRAELTPLQPFLSKDIDLLGDEATYAELRRLGEWSAGALFRPKPGQEPPAVVAALTAQRPDGTVLAIEIRRAVYGLTNDDLAKVTEVFLDGDAYVVMEPHVVLKGKLANLADLPQQGRQDAKHVRILVPCVRAYLENAAAAVTGGTLEAAVLERLRAEVREIVNSAQAGRAAAALELDFSSVVKTASN